VEPSDEPVNAMSSVSMRVGGMAFGNGVLMRGPRFWAWARADGTIVEGRLRTFLSKYRWLRVPLLRSVVVFVEMIGMAIRLHRQNGLRRGAVLLTWLGLCLAFDLCLSLVLPLLIPSALLANVLLEVLGLAFGLLALRQGLGATVWQYHGAEHKAVNAYEGGADLTDTRAVMTYSRIHDRCGTNLVVIILLLLMLGYLPAGGLAMGEVFGAIYGIFVIAVSLEFFRLVTRSPNSRASRVVLAGGRALQRCVTTREPAVEHLELACIALRRVVALERGA
jgi:uncharacterized protein YqhQ